MTFQYPTMFKQHYYCLIAGLPDLVQNEFRKGLTALQFRRDVAEELTPSDYALLQLLFRQNDNQNLLNLILQQDFQFDIRGNYTEDYLKNQIVEPTDIAAYMNIFITELKSENPDQSNLSIENRLQELFYNDVLKTNNAFIRKWFAFERNLKNMLTVIACNQYGYDIPRQLIPDKNRDDLNKLLIRGNLKPELFVDEDLPWIDQVLRIAESGADMVEKEKAIDNIKWTYLDEITVSDYFTIEKILSFVIKLKILDRWHELDDEAGLIFLKRLINDLEMSYSFAE